MNRFVNLEDIVQKITWQRQPISLVVLVIMLLSLNACSENVSTPPHSLPSLPNPGTNTSQDTGGDKRVLEDFVDAINAHQVDKALDLFNEQAFITEFSQVDLGRNSEQNNLAYSCNGKAEIKGWLEYKVKAITEITPIEYTISADAVTLQAVFNFSDYSRPIRVDALIEEGKFSNLSFFAEETR